METRQSAPTDQPGLSWSRSSTRRSQPAASSSRAPTGRRGFPGSRGRCLLLREPRIQPSSAGLPNPHNPVATLQGAFDLEPSRLRIAGPWIQQKTTRDPPGPPAPLHCIHSPAGLSNSLGSVAAAHWLFCASLLAGGGLHLGPGIELQVPAHCPHFFSGSSFSWQLPTLSFSYSSTAPRTLYISPSSPSLNHILALFFSPCPSHSFATQLLSGRAWRRVSGSWELPSDSTFNDTTPTYLLLALRPNFFFPASRNTRKQRISFIPTHFRHLSALLKRVVPRALAARLKPLHDR